MRVNNILTGNYRKAFLAVCVIGLGIIILLLIPAMQEKRNIAIPLTEPSNREMERLFYMRPLSFRLEFTLCG